MDRLNECLLALSAEFGFDTLSMACDVFGKTGSPAILGRLRAVEDRQISLDRSRAHEASEERRLSTKLQRLEADVTRLSSLCSSLESRLSDHARLFEAEQSYRRGCEALFATHDHDCHGEFLSEKLGLSILKGAADAGHTDAQYRYGRCLLIGRGCAPDATTARRYLTLSANAGNSYAESSLGKCFRDGQGGPQDIAQAVKLIKQSAGHGNAVGQNNLAWLYENGVGVAKDLVLAVKYFKHSATQGNSWGQCRYAQCLVDGIGCAADPAVGVSVVKKAADKGFAFGQCTYGSYLERGTGIDQDKRLAKHYYKLAMEGGYTAAAAAYSDLAAQSTQLLGLQK
jgi:TPR repeat protein